MNKIAGKVILKETGIGIPDLLIAIHDLDPGTKPEEIIKPSGDSNTINNPSLATFGDRIGSILTNESGEFELDYEDEEFRIRNEEEKRPDFLLLVLAPEESGKDLSSRILYATVPSVRQNAGRLESYIIRLTKEQLEKAEIEIPSETVQDPGNIIDRFTKFDQAQSEIESGVKKQQKIKLKALQTKTETFTKKIKPELIKALSFVPGRTILTTEDTGEPENGLINTTNFVLPGQSVKKATEEVVKAGIAQKFKDNTLTGFIGLTEKKLEALQELSGDDTEDFFEISEEEFNTVIFKEVDDNEKQEERISTILFRDDPIAKLCREKTLGDICLRKEDEETDGGSGDEADDEVDIGGNGVETITSEDIPKYVASLVDTQTSPEEFVSFGVSKKSKRASQEDVQNNIDALKFRVGPADTVSFHDFHNLQIAFEHVWEEAIDEGIIDLAEEAYKEIVELGGDPSVSGSSKGNAASFVKHLNLTLSYITQANFSEPPGSVIRAFNITKEQWNVLNLGLRKDLESISKFVNKISGRAKYTDDNSTIVISPRSPRFKEFRNKLHNQGEQIVAYANSLLIKEENPYDRLHKILKELNQRIKEDYPFTVYAANRQERSINFGILVTYRQKWEPVNYQAGELSHTQTLAPKESRKFSTKTVIKKKRFEKEIEKSLFSRKQESDQKSRAETEILRKAESNTNFKTNSQNNINYGIYGGTHTVDFGGDASKTSNEVKKSFREEVFKAAEEYKKERTIEVSTEETFEEEFTESGEIMNPNDELPVTFLFYELQRRYRISEHIHRLTPVVLVAQETPKPHEIDEDWIIAHDWILRRVILDDSFLPAMDYLNAKVVGDEIALQEMKKNVDQQRKITDELKEELVTIRSQVTRRRIAMERAIEERAGIIGGDEGLREDIERIGQAVVTSGLTEVGRFFGFGGGNDDENAREAARIRQDAARDAFEQTLNEEKKLLGRLEREVTALHEMSDTYTKLLSNHLNQRNQILRLRLHIKQNMFYYMQAIWSHEPDDQRFFRLHKVQVPTLKGKRKYRINKAPLKETALYHLPRKGISTHRFNVSSGLETNGEELETVDLVEIADLDNLLGYKGNYMMFPLIKSNPLTDFMMQPYIDSAFGDFMNLHDPDEFGNFSLEDFSKYVCCLKEKKPDEFEDLEGELKEIFEKLLNSPLRNNEEIIVPTGSLFVEALPGSHAILEDFKLMHRAIDVKKVQAEVREMELENIRAAARLLASKDDIKLLDDPDIESIKQVFVSGNDVQPNIDVGDDS